MKADYNIFNIDDVASFSILMVSSVGILIASNLSYGFLPVHLFPYVESGKLAHYYVNYFDVGFVKRGLFGSIISGLTGAPDIRHIRFFAFMLGLFICFLACFHVQKIRRYFDKRSYYLVAGLIIFSPATIFNIGQDLGRYDQLLMLCSILSLYAIKNRDIAKLIIITVTAVLIHELYIIMFFPVVLYVSLFHSELEFKKISWLLLILGALSLLIFFFGKIEHLNVPQIAEVLSTNEFKFNNLGLIWKRTISDNIRYTLGYLSDYSSRDILWLTAGAGYTLLIFLMLIGISVVNHLDYRGYIVILTASLPIFLLAIDYSRWYSLMMINTFIYFIYIVKKEKANTLKISDGYAMGISLLVAGGIVLGPVGVIRSFPLFDDLMTLIFIWVS